MADIRRNRTAILVAGVCTMLMFGTIYSWSVFIPPLEAEFGWTRSQTSAVFSVAMIGLSFGMLSIGFLQKRFSLRACFAVSTCCVVVGMLLCSTVRDIVQLYVFYGFFCGFGSGMSYTVWTTNVMAWYGDRVGFASGVLVMGFGMGAVVLGSFASALIYSPLGWRAAFAVIGVVALVEGVLAFQFVQTPPPEVANLKSRKNDFGVSLPGSRVVREPSFWLFCLWRSIVMGACGAVIAEATVMIMEIGASVALATGAAGALGLGNGLGRPLGGIVYDRIGQARTLVVLPLLAVVVSVGMAVAYWVASPVPFVAFLLADGVVYGMYSAINTSYMRTTFGQKHLSTNTGMSAVVLAPFNLVFPAVAAFAFEATGTYEWFFLAVPILAGVSLASGALCNGANARLRRACAEKGGAGEGGAAVSAPVDAGTANVAGSSRR